MRIYVVKFISFYLIKYKSLHLKKLIYLKFVFKMRYKEQFYFSIIYQYFKNITLHVYNKSYSKGPLFKKKNIL